MQQTLDNCSERASTSFQEENAMDEIFLRSLGQRTQGSLGKEQNTDHWCSGLTCFPVTEEITSLNLVWSATFIGSLAQLGEHRLYTAEVVGSSPITSTIKFKEEVLGCLNAHCRRSSMVERDLAKVDTRVRFPSSPPTSI